MRLNDLLEAKGIDPKHVLVLRHRPTEPMLNKVLPWLAAERPEVYNAFQQTQGGKLESSMHKMVGSGYVASFIRHGPGKALFVGLYSITGSKPLTHDEFWQVPAYIELKSFGMRGWAADALPDNTVLWIDLTPTDVYLDWKGKLVVGWPPPERSWYRRAKNNVMPVLAIREESALGAAMPAWDEIALSWDELRVLPSRWRSAIEQWRAIYYIFDASDAKGYVGSAYGLANLASRWDEYAATGHGGNALLKGRDPKNFRFSIPQRVSPDAPPDDVIRLEASWKRRLYTLAPHGLNDN